MATRESRSARQVSRGLALVQRDDLVEASLWRRAQSERDEQARVKLFDSYQPLANQIAATEFAKRRGLGVELQELRQLAYEGLLQALASFDPGREVPFAGYARRRIRGNILDGLSKNSESSAQYKYSKRVERERIQSLGLGPDDREKSAIEGLSELASLLAIGLLLEEQGTTDSEQLKSSEKGAYETLAWAQMQEHLSDQIDKLTERERFVINQHYRKDVAFSQIAELLGLSRGRISQIHKAVLQHLRAHMQRFR